jgi:histone acetyltransferase 1
MDLRAALDPFFAPEAFERGADAAADKEEGDGSSWTPPGPRLAKYRDDGRGFEVWAAGMADRKAMAIMKNMKVLIPMFIDGGTVTFLEDDDVPVNAWTIGRWTLFLLYQVDGSEYTLAGFATSYRLWV